MDKKTPNKRKSLANVDTTPTKLQKLKSPASQQKTPKSANKNQKTPQKKQLNGRQATPRQKKQPVKEESEDDDEEDESDESIEQQISKLNGNSDDSEEDEDSDEDAEDGNENEGDDEDDTKDKKPAIKIKEDRKFSAYVGNLPLEMTSTELTEFFDDGDDNVLSVFLLKNPVNLKFKGSAFVNFKSEAALTEALQKDEATILDKTIKVSRARRPDDPDRQIHKKKMLLANLKRKVAKLEKELKDTNMSPTQGRKFSPGKGKPYKKNKGGKKIKQEIKQERA